MHVLPPEYQLGILSYFILTSKQRVSFFFLWIIIESYLFRQGHVPDLRGYNKECNYYYLRCPPKCFRFPDGHVSHQPIATDMMEKKEKRKGERQRETGRSRWELYKVK